MSNDLAQKLVAACMDKYIQHMQDDMLDAISKNFYDPPKMRITNKMERALGYADQIEATEEEIKAGDYIKPVIKTSGKPVQWKVKTKRGI